MIPAKAFEHERGYLRELTPHLGPPYQSDERDTDQYGYVAFNGNYYWVPGIGRATVKVLCYADRLKICQGGTILAEYPLPADGVKNHKFSPPGQPAPRHPPQNRKHDSQPEEQRLRALGAEVSAYWEFAVKTPGVQRHRFTRQLFHLSQQLTDDVFRETARRALRYRITDLNVLERIAWLCLNQGPQRIPDIDWDEGYQQRPAYQEGHLTDLPDLSVYDQPESNPESNGDGEVDDG